MPSPAAADSPGHHRRLGEEGTLQAPAAHVRAVVSGDVRVDVRDGEHVVRVLAGFWLLVRQQAAIGDEQFLRSMIPHHAGAMLMCQQAGNEDAQVVRLCGNIVSGQQAEVDEMKGMLARLGK